MVKRDKQPRSKSGVDVNTGVDAYLRLVPIPGITNDEGFPHKVRALQIGVRCKALEELKKWGRSSPQEARRILGKLKLMAETVDELHLKTVKRVGKRKQIVEVKAENARLFCFYEGELRTYTIICLDTFWIGSGNKKSKQSDAITRAEELMDRWQNAHPVVGLPDVRIESKG